MNKGLALNVNGRFELLANSGGHLFPHFLQATREEA
jgi:hypothetical protein